MKYLFEYNWQVRNEWFDLCKTISNDKLYEERIGGHRSIAQTLFHITKVEYDWICDLQQKPIFEGTFEQYQTFDEIIQLSADLQVEVRDFIQQWQAKMDDKVLNIDFGDGNHLNYTYGEAIRHIIVHEVHHIGQLSIWAREIGIVPINSNFINRGLFITK